MRRRMGGRDFGHVINRRTWAHAIVDGKAVTIVMATRTRSASFCMHWQYLAGATERLLCCFLNFMWPAVNKPGSSRSSRS
jgi:hypothetical protein